MSLLPIGVDTILSGHVVESARIEFKRSWNTGPTALQTLQTIAAFANDFQNLNGGYVVLGVEAHDGVPVLPPVGLVRADIDAAQQWIRGNCRRLEPEYQPVLSPELVSDRHILVLWCPGSDTRPHSAPTSLAGGDKKYFVRLGSETVEAKGDLLPQLLQMTARVPFDDRRALSVPIERIREASVREFLADVRSDLLNEPDAREMYRRLKLSARSNGAESPRNIALLFFADDPEEWFPGARIEVVQFSDDLEGNVLEERVFKGPLQHQLRNVIDYLRGFSTEHLKKLGDRPETKGWVSYPLPALEEAVVNAVYHRSYEGVPEPTKVYLFPDRIEVISYPGPIRGIEPRHLQQGERVPPVPARNRRIGEILKELRLAEARGTGIPKVYRAMLQNGSPSPRFDFDAERTYFRVVLPAHPQYVAIKTLRDSAHLRAIGEAERSLERLTEAFDTHPDSPLLALAVMEELLHQDLPTSALGAFDRHLTAVGGRLESNVVVVAARAALDARERRRALELLEALPDELDPSSAVEAAILEKRLGRDRRAHHLFQLASSAVFGDVRALHEFAQVKIRLAATGAKRSSRSLSPLRQEAAQRLLRDAREMLERVLQMDGPPSRQAWAWFDLARVLSLQGAPLMEARAALDKAMSILPNEQRFKNEAAKLA